MSEDPGKASTLNSGTPIVMFDEGFTAGGGALQNFDSVWTRITAGEGLLFHQKMGKPFRYSIEGQAVRPTTTDRLLHRSQFEEAFQRLPFSGPADLQDLQGPSYLYAILQDVRISGLKD